MNETAERWLAFAREDLRVAEVVLDEAIFNQACFHAQQCVEKALKSLLAHQSQTPPRIHAIADLLGLLPAEWFVELRDGLLRMDDYYIPTRYPDALPGSLPEGLPGRAEAEEAVNLAHRALERVSQLMRG